MQSNNASQETFAPKDSLLFSTEVQKSTSNSCLVHASALSSYLNR